MTLDQNSLKLLQDALDTLNTAFADMPAYQPDVDLDALRPILLQAAEKMQDNYPYPHPLYAGQMLKPPHPIARLAYMLALYINPNNHALDGGRASSAMEKAAVAEIAAMFGWETHLGHLTGGGTMANLEALYIAGQLAPGKIIVGSEQAHYTHSRISNVLQLPYAAIPTDAQARMDLDALEKHLQGGDIGTVVVTLGTTATGSVDPLPEILALREQYNFRVHVDAAYGGYFTLADNLAAEARAAFDAITAADSICIDPHKHGLQPYGCGCVLFKDPAIGRYYQHDSPYTYFTSDDLHLGEISLECSRAGASAVGLWATQKLLPLTPGSPFAADMSKTHGAALVLADKLAQDTRFIVPFMPQLDIVVWAIRADSREQMSALAQAVFDRAAAQHLHLALANLPAHLFGDQLPETQSADETVVCLRSVLMKPEHADWVALIWSIIDKVTDAAIEAAP
jgi:tyrosine decarboxylase / aspartate 1-decarboxylase